jgi:hypothetical protein
LSELVGDKVVIVEDDDLLGLPDGLEVGVSLGVEVVGDKDILADGVSCDVDGLSDGLMDGTFVISGESVIDTEG